MIKIGFLGFGNMASAIARGIIGKGFVNASDIAAYDPSDEVFDSFGENIVKSQSPLQLAESAKYLFVCVKPQIIDDALKSVAPALSSESVIVSIAAGVTVEQISALTGKETGCIIRVMPNTPLLLGSGTTAIARPALIGDDDYKFVLEVFGCVGSVYEIPRDKFNEIIPVNGSSPAFIYLFAKTAAECARKFGIDEKTAADMFADTLIGSARMMKESGFDLETLISMVSSKGGTTVAALETMRDAGFCESIERGFDSCVRRAYELGKT